MPEQFDANYFTGLSKELSGDIAQEARRTLIASSDTNPDEAAKAAKLSRQFGVPQVAVEQDLSFYEKEKKFPAEYFTALSSQAPDLAAFIANQDNAKIIHDDVGALLYTSDKMRSVAGAAVQFGSNVIGGTGDMLKSISELAPEGQVKGDALGLNGPIDRILWPLSIGTVGLIGDILDFSSEGGLDKAAEFIRPPQERRDFVDSVAEGIGQVASQLVLFARNPAAATGALFATGAEQQSDRLDAAGVNDPSRRLLAQIGGGAVTAATERVQLGILLNRVPGLKKLLGKAPKALQNKWFDRVIDVGTAAGAEATQEVVEGFLQDLIAQQVYNPDQEFFETIREEASTAGVVGAIARTTILAVTGGRRASTYQAQADQAQNLRSVFTEAKQAGEATQLISRDPEKFKEFLSISNSDGQEITLDGTFVEELYQSDVDVEKFFEAVPEARAQFEESQETGSDIRLPVDKVAFAMMQDEENKLDFMADFVKLEDGISPRQVDDPDFINQQIEEIMQQAREEQASFENESKQQEFYERIEQQVADNLMDANRLGEKARTPDAARQEAALYASFAKTLVERGGEQARAVLENLFGGNFSIRGPQKPPPSLPITNEDLYIDSLRKKEKAKNAKEKKKNGIRDLLGKVRKPREKATPTPLINMLIDRGKIKRGSVIAKELEAIGITTKSHPRLFSKDGALSDIDNLVQSEVEDALGVSGIFTINDTGYIDRQQLLDLLRDESFGEYIKTDAQIEEEQQSLYDEQILDELFNRGIDITTADNDTIKRTLAQAAQDYADGAYFQNVYHGTDKDFQEFDLDKIGSSDGNLKFGYGFYFTNNSSVANEYKTANGRVIEADIPEDSSLIDWDDTAENMPVSLEDITYAMDKDGKIDSLIEELNENEDVPFQSDPEEQVNEYLSGEDNYDDISEYASEEQLELLDKLRMDYGFDAPASELTGGNVYNLVAGSLGSKKAASELFYSLGVKGVKADDATLKNGDKNYVVFNPSDIKTLNSNVEFFQSSNPPQIEQDITKSKEFKEWFGDSKVVDGNGDPLVVYHGTDADIEEFILTNKNGKLLFGEGFYFTPNPKRASSFAEQGNSNGQNVIPVYLSLKNPFIVDTLEKRSELTLMALNGDSKKITNNLKSNGYDGIIVRDTFNNNHEYIAFEPTQIKSVNNRGTFDANDPRILYQQSKPKEGMKRLYRGLEQELDESFDQNRTDAPSGYSTWTDNPELARQYAGENGHIYFIDLPENKIGNEVINEDGDRVLFFDNEKPAALNGVSGKEFLVYTEHDEYSDDLIQKLETKKLFQNKDTKRGSIQFGDQGQRVINLFEGADESTFFHETGHLFLDIFGQIAADPNATEEIKAEYSRALEWLGVESADQIGTEQHEKWARGFEAYLYEGKSPSEKLRATFDRFKIWLINVYKNTKALNVKLDDNIRGVFDRLLATDSEIEALRENTLFRPNEQTLEMLNKAEREKYLKQQTRAISEAKNKLFRKALRQKRRENAKWYKEERAKVQADEEELLQGSGVYRAMQIVTTGKDFNGDTVFEGETKISESDVVELYGNKEILKYLPRGSRTKGQGIDLKILAEMYGFKNPKDMIDAMINVDPYKLRLQKNTDEEMIRRHGDMLNDGTIEREALEMVMSQSPELNMTELQSLSRRTGQEYPSDGDFKIAAKRAISEQKLDHSIKPDKYYRAALKAEREYGKALSKEDFEAAADAKRRVILNKHMYREARDARMEVDKALKKFQKLSKQPPKKKKPVIDPEYHEKIWDALGAYQLGPRLTDQKRLKLELSAINEWIQAKEQDEFAQLLIPPEIIAAQEKTHYRDLTLNEFRGLRDLVVNLETQGRRKLQYIREGEKRDLNELIDELERSAAQHNRALEKPLSKRQNERLSKKIGSLVGAIDAVNTKASTILSQLDGGEFGIWTRTIFEPIQAAEVQKSIRSREEMKNLQGIIDKHYGKDFRKKRVRLKLDSKTEIVDRESYVQTFMEEEFTVTDGEVEESLTREMILSIALNQGTADNQIKLLDGHAKANGWTQEFIDDALSKMTKRDWEFVQDTWNYMDSFWPEVSKIEAKRFGYAPEKIEHQPLTVTTSDGHTMNLDGGYMRIKYDRNQDVQAEKEAIAEINKDVMVGASARAQTKNGSTNERVDNVKRPIRLDMDVISEHINEQVAFITMSEAVENANKVLRKQRVQEALQNYVGPEARLMLETWLQDTASGGVMAGGVINRGMRAMRGNYTLGRLGLRPMTALLQFSGLAQTAGDIGTKNMVKGLVKVFSTGNPYSISNEIKAKSPMMKEREFTLTRDVADAMRTLTRPDAGAVSHAAAYMLYPMQKMQEIVDAVTWTANYQKAIREGFDDSDAIRQADIAVSRTQGSGLISDLAAIERGTLNEQTQRQEWVKLATMFFSYFNAKYNVIKNKNIQYRNQKIGLPDLAVSYMMTFMLEGLISALIMGQLDFDRDDDERISGSEIAMTIGMLTLNQGAASVPFVRDIAGAAEGFTSQGAAQAQLQNVGSFLGTLGTTAIKMSEGDDVNWYSFMRGATNTVNAVLPIPAGMINQALRGAEQESKSGDAQLIDYLVYREK